MTTFTANAIASANINERFTLSLTADGDITGYSFTWWINVNGESLVWTRTANTEKEIVLSERTINGILTSVWDTRNVSGSWSAQIYFNGEYVGNTNTANIGFVIPNMGHTIDVTITDINSTVTALTGDNTKFIVPYSKPSVSAVIGHVNPNDRSAIAYWEMTVDSPDGMNAEVSEQTRTVSAGETSYTASDAFTIASTYAVTVRYRDSRNYTGTLRYAPSTWDGSTYHVPYMKQNEGFARNGTNSTIVKLKCQPCGWLQSFGAQTNTLTLTIDVKEYGQDDTQYVTKNTFSIASNPSALTEYTVYNVFAVSKNYVCRWTLTDKLGSVVGAEQLVTSSYPVFSISENRMDVFGELVMRSMDNGSNQTGDISLYAIGSIRDSLFYKPGNTLNFNSQSPLTGYVISSATKVYITVPVGKSLQRITNVTVSKMIGAIVSNSGSLNVPSASSAGSLSTDWLSASDISVAASIINEHTVLVVVTGTSALYGATNNRPVIYVPANGGLTLAFGGIL